MSFGGKTFKKQLLKKELEQLTKQSQDEFSSLPASEKEALRQKTKTNAFERPKLKKKKHKIDEISEERDILAETPSVDLEAEFKNVEFSHEEFPFVKDEEVKGTTGSAKVASIKANVNLHVVMQGRKVDDKNDVSGPVTAARNSKASQRSSGNSPTAKRRPFSSSRGPLRTTPPVNTHGGVIQKPAIISSQNSTMQLQLNQRPTPKPVSVTSRPGSKVSGRASGKQSRASLAPSDLAEGDAKNDTNNEAPREVHIPQVQQTEVAEQEDEIEVEGENKGEICKEEENNEQKIQLSPLPEDKEDKEDSSPIPLNPSDIIHSEIQLLTKSLMSQDSSIINILQSYDIEKNTESEANKTKELTSHKNVKTTEDEGFGLLNGSVPISPLSPRKSDNQVFEKKHNVSQKSMGESKTDLKSTPPTREWPGLVSSELKQASLTSFTDEEAQQIMDLPLDVKSEDIISIQGTKTQLIESEVTGKESVSWLGSWSEKKVALDHNIHHFCTMATTMEISPQMHQMTRDSHTPDRLYRARQRYNLHEDSAIHETKPLFTFQESEEYYHNILAEKPSDEERRMSIIAHRILDKALSGEPDEVIKKLKAASDQLFLDEDEKTLEIQGVKLDVKDDSSRLYWTPAPPKMGLAPETIKTHLFPEYQGAEMLKDSIGTDHVALTALPESEDEEDEEDGTAVQDDRTSGTRFLDRTHRSLSDLSQVGLTTDALRPNTDNQSDHTQEQHDIIRFESLLDKRRQQIKEEKEDLVKLEDRETDGETEVGDLVPEEHPRPFRRAQSEPMLSFDKERVKLVSNYDVSMKELQYQLNAVAAAKEELQGEDDADDEAEEDDHDEQTSTIKDMSTLDSLYSQSLSTDFPSKTKENESHENEESKTDMDTMSITTSTSKQTAMTVKTHRLSIPRGKLHKRPKQKTKMQIERQKQVKAFLEKPPNEITRSVSFCNLLLLKQNNDTKQDDEESFEMNKTPSVNDLQNFENLIHEDPSKPIDDMYDWTRENYWYKWFDEVYPPSTATPELRYDFLSVTSPRATTTMSKSTSGAVIDNAVLDTIQVIKPEMQDTDDELYQLLLQEIESLTLLIDKTEKKETLAVYLCRRGAINRKIGELKKAWDDLNKSIELESLLLDAYWHRHLLHLLQNNKKAALDDLTFIIKINGSSARAYRSRAELYRQLGDATMAIVNYSQAIKLNPSDVETYYQRANMFKLRGDMLLALEDYNIAAKLLPSRTEAKFEVGKFHFDHENWNGAINDFNAILQQDPVDSLAYTYRGRVFKKMGQFDNALRDFCAAIHYNPDNAVALYHRACILRKLHPRRALQDLSVSLLLDSSINNVNAFLHRGILYTDLKRWEDAIPDFEAALELDPTLACARVNIGLIYITKYNNYHRAIRQYTSAIHVDPTYIRARICRAEAYQKLGMLQEAVMDYTHVIHVRPDVPDYHMARGKLLLEQNKLDLASYHVKQAAKLNQGLGASPTQQAVVQSFLNNFDLAIQVLDRATRVNPSAQLFVLLGKTNMKAKRFPDAIVSFKKAITVMTPWHTRIAMPLEAAPVYYMIGICHSELFEFQNALDAFNSAIKVNPEYAEAFYQRGLTKMKLRYTRGIHDFNRALAINPKLFQAFLSRAAYYGMKNRFSKGIMSCNEAIKLQPRSVRAYLYRGALKYHIKAYGLAVKDLTEAVAIDCRCSLAYFNRAVCYHGMKFYQKALMDYSTVLLLENKPNIKVLQNRGLLYHEINDTENALEDFKAAAKISTVDPLIRHALGYCYHKLNRLEEAVASYDDALRIDPFFVEAYNGRGNALMDYGHEQGNVLGRRDYLKALHINPRCLSARVNLAYNLQVEGKFQDAWKQFSAAIAMDTTCQAALEGRAVINLQMRNTFGALVDLNDAIKISKTAELLNNRGVVHQFMNDYVNAVRDYQAAIRLEPSYALSYYNAGNVYFKQRQFKQALSYYDRALSWTPDDESFVLNRAITKVLLRDPKGAIHDFNKAVELNPYAAHVYFNRGNLYASLRKYKEAEDDYTRALSLCPGDALVYKRRADVLGKQSKRDAAIKDYKNAIIIKTRATNRKG